MCRLLYLPRRVRPTLKVLTRWLETLDDTLGGDGCGFATLKKGIVKGVQLTPAESAKEIKRLRGCRVLWHTRAISCGMKSDELCHPFETKKGCYLVHNGHWRQGAFTARVLKGNWNDTAVAALWIRLHGWKSFCRECDSGVWLHLTPKGLQVHYPSGSLYREYKSGALCSEPCHEWGNWEAVETGTYHIGEEIKVKSVRTLFKDGIGKLTWETDTSEDNRLPEYYRNLMKR